MLWCLGENPDMSVVMGGWDPSRGHAVRVRFLGVCPGGGRDLTSVFGTWFLLCANHSHYLIYSYLQNFSLTGHGIGKKFGVPFNRISICFGNPKIFLLDQEPFVWQSKYFLACQFLDLACHLELGTPLFHTLHSGGIYRQAFSWALLHCIDLLDLVASLLVFPSRLTRTPSLLENQWF